MRFGRDQRRKLTSHVVTALCILCVAVALIPLGSILYTSAVRGYGAVTQVSFFTNSGPPSIICEPGASCNSGGINNALVGTLILVGLAGLIAFPVGILTGIFMAEYGTNRVGRSVRFLVNVMSGIPSIVIGIVVFAFLVYLADANYLESRYVFSAFSGVLALAFVMVPLVARTSDEALKLVPTATREAALALGIPRGRSILRVVLPSCRSAVVTGALLATARAAGETAPLLMTAFGNNFGFQGLDRPVEAMPLVIYYFGISGVPSYETIAWGAALVLILIMLTISLTARYALARTMARGAR